MFRMLAAKGQRHRRGVFLIATTPQHLDEAKLCIASLRAVCEIPITICTHLTADVDVNIVHPPVVYGTYQDKPCCLSLSPYPETLFLDTDTLILRRDFLALFQLCNKFDIALAHAPLRAIICLKHVPICFPEFNSGVILFRRNRETHKIFRRWQEEYGRMKSDLIHLQEIMPDQPSLRAALYSSNLRIATLTPEYNYRCLRISQFTELRSIRILHNRPIQQKVVFKNGIIDRELLYTSIAERLNAVRAYC